MPFSDPMTEETPMKVFVTSLLSACLVFGLAAESHAFKMTFKDPKGDDKGPGKYTYPTHQSYRKGAFDMRKVTIKTSGSNIEVNIRMRRSIKDVWKSRGWGGNGFSVQFAQLYIRTGKGKGFHQSLPGMNVRFKQKWNFVVLLSPQGKTRLRSEINLKAKRFKKQIIIPTITRKQGKSIIAIFPKNKVPGFTKSSGIQVLMQSNEGYPRKQDLLTRPVNEYNGKHRFGGGNDGDCDPHVIDMLAGKGNGSSSEKAKQYKMLGSFSCKGKKRRATIGFVRK
jgi:carbohydrate-binding DOMON domain-containing protein